ncbi:hypothetical protein Tco_1198211 [Tanacetum coccineum]
MFYDMNTMYRKLVRPGVVVKLIYFVLIKPDFFGLLGYVSCFYMISTKPMRRIVTLKNVGFQKFLQLSAATYTSYYCQFYLVLLEKIAKDSRK